MPTAAFVWNSVHHPLGNEAHRTAFLDVRGGGMSTPGDREDRPDSLVRTLAHWERRLTNSLMLR